MNSASPSTVAMVSNSFGPSLNFNNTAMTMAATTAFIQQRPASYASPNHVYYYNATGSTHAFNSGLSTGVKVGIGTTTPTATLHVAGGSSTVLFEGLSGSDTRMLTVSDLGILGAQSLPTDAQALSINGSTISLANGGSVTVPSSADNMGNHLASQTLALADNALRLRGAGDANHQLNFDSGVDGPVLTGYGGGQLGTRNVTTYSAALSWNRNGNVGIGTGNAAPVGRLDVRMNSDDNGISLMNTLTPSTIALEANAFGPALTFHNSLTTTAVSTAFIQQRPSTIGSPHHVFYYNAIGTAHAFISGNNAGVQVGIGTTTPSATLHVVGNAKIEGVNTLEFGAGIAGKEVSAGKIGYKAFSADALDIVGAGNSSGPRTVRVYAEAGTFFNGPVTGVGAFNSSDQRLKQDIRPLTGALALVQHLNGRRYQWNALGVQRGGKAGVEQVGVIAQELEQVLPELVNTDSQGFKAVNYAQLTPVLIEAIKELQAEVEAQRSRANRAEATVDSFEQRLNALEAATGHAQR